MKSLLSTLRQRLFKHNVDQHTVTLSQRRIYILPTGHGLAFACVLVLMLLGSINYNLSLGYILTFFISVISALSMFYAFRNMTQLQVSLSPADSVFCGDKATFTLRFLSHQDRYQLHLKDSRKHSVNFDLIASESECNEIPFTVDTKQRGQLALGPLTLYTEFPLGLFRAWSYLNFEAHCVVYPALLEQCPTPQFQYDEHEGSKTIQGDEDFAGLKTFQRGDTLSRVDWKAFARERGLLIKQFSATQSQVVCFDLQHTPFQQREQQLSCLATWLLAAEQQGLIYGLKLHQQQIQPAQGAGHLHHCLTQLALFEAEQLNG